jgi:undecaprenyl diphosphate synthase
MSAIAAIPDTGGPTGNYPTHVAIIMDGNSRWASDHGMSRQKGHQQGAEALRNLLRACKNHPYVRHITAYAFSYENWRRSPEEVRELMDLLRHYLTHETKKLAKENICMRFIGDRNLLDADIQEAMRTIELENKNPNALTLTLAISYGARQEIVAAMQSLATQVQMGTLQPNNLNEALISQTLYTHSLPDPDLLIRTGGDMRLSNFLLWQSAYTELYFSDILWPDFTAQHFEEALTSYTLRERRFGTRTTASNHG